jgi:multidrug transporter EmrE-like cation transporter
MVDLHTITGWLGVAVIIVGVAFIIAAIQSPIALAFAGQFSEISIRGPRLLGGLVTGIVLLGVGFWGVSQAMKSINIQIELN